MDYKLKLLYESLINGNNLIFGKFKLVKNTHIDEYDYDEYKDDKKIISGATRKNLELVERKAGAVFTKIYRADKSNGRGVYSTYILGTLHNYSDKRLNNRPFIWAREETTSAMSGTTKLVFEDEKLSGTKFLASLAKTITKEGDLYKIINERERTVRYSKDIEGQRLHRDDGPALIAYDSKGNIETEAWYTNGQINRDSEDGPAMKYYKSGKLVGYEYRREGRYHRPEDDGPAIEHKRGKLDHIVEYCQNGVLHRMGGPAQIGDTRYSTHGTEQAVYINGLHIFSLLNTGLIQRGNKFI